MIHATISRDQVTARLITYCVECAAAVALAAVIAMNWGPGMIRRAGVAFVFVMAALILMGELDRYNDRAASEIETAALQQ